MSRSRFPLPCARAVCRSASWDEPFLSLPRAGRARPSPPRAAPWLAWAMSMQFQFRSHRLRPVQRRDLARGKAELLEHGVGVLAALRGRRRETRASARQRHRLANEAQRPPAPAANLLRNAEMADLWISEHLIDGINWPARHAR